MKNLYYTGTAVSISRFSWILYRIGYAIDYTLWRLQNS